MKIQKILGSIVLATTLSLVAANTQTQAEGTIRDYTRIAGDTRTDTAIEVSRKGWANGSSKTVIIASGENFPDALAGGPLAKKYNAPILLVNKSNLHADVLTEMKRLGVTKAIILGGSNTVSESVANQLNAATSQPVERIAGEDRYETAELIANKVGGTTAIVVNGSSFPDSLSIASYAAQKGIPILLTSKSEIQFDQKYSSYIVVGGENAVSETVVSKLKASRVAGNDRYETMQAVINKFYPTTGIKPLVASGVNFADALTGSVYAAKLGVPVLLVGKDVLPTATKKVIEAKKMPSLVVVGGKSAVSSYALGAPKPVVKPVSNPTPAPKPVATVSANEKLVAKAKQYLGTKYVYGGTTPSGFDCSGYIYYVHNAAGIKLTRTNTSGYYNMTTRVSSPQPGDLVFFSNTYKAGISHMGIYIGNGSFIHAGGDRVQINKVTDYYWRDKFTSYNRFK